MLGNALGHLDALGPRIQQDRARLDSLRAEEIHWTRQQRESLEGLQAAVRKLEDLKPSEERNQFNARPPGYRKQFRAYQNQVPVAEAARLQLLEAETKVHTLQEEKKLLDQRLSDFLHRVGEAERLLQEAEAKPDATPAILDRLRTRIQVHGGRLQLIDLPHERRNGSILVRARLNNRADATLLLDTGASLVVLSRNLANRAGVTQQTGPLMTRSMADGSPRNLPAALVDILQVGPTQGKLIPAVISEAPPGQDIDGLLGMSFLEQFDWSYDPRTDRLVLRQVRTP